MRHQPEIDGLSCPGFASVLHRAGKKAVDADRAAGMDTAVNGDSVASASRNRTMLSDQSLWPVGERFQQRGQYRQAVGGGFPPMDRRAAVKELQKRYPDIKKLESIGAVSSDVQGDTRQQGGRYHGEIPERKNRRHLGMGRLPAGRVKALKRTGVPRSKLYSIDISSGICS